MENLLKSKRKFLKNYLSTYRNFGGQFVNLTIKNWTNSQLLHAVSGTRGPSKGFYMKQKKKKKTKMPCCGIAGGKKEGGYLLWINQQIDATEEAEVLNSLAPFSKQVC